MSARLKDRVRERFEAVLAWGRKAAHDPQGELLVRLFAGQVPPDSGPSASAELDALEKRLPELVTSATAGLECFVETLIRDERDRAEVLEAAQAATAAQSGDEFLDALQKAASIEWRDEIGATWPRDVTADDVLAWLASLAERDARLRPGVAAIRKSFEDGIARLRAPVATIPKGIGDGLTPVHPRFRLELDEHALTFGGAAVLFSVERAIRRVPLRARAPGPVMLDNTDASRALAQIMAGSNVEEYGPYAVRDRGAIRVDDAGQDSARVFLEWGVGSTRKEIQLPLPGTESTLIAKVCEGARAEYGIETVRVLLAAAAFSFWQGKRAAEAVWLYPHDVARLFGIRADSKARARFVAALKRLESGRIVIQYRGRNPLTEKILDVNAEYGRRAFRVTVASSLFSGVRERDGSLGRCFVVAPLELYRQSPRALLLPLLAGPAWRATIGNGETPRLLIRAERLAAELGISSRAEEREGRLAPDRKHDARTLSALDATLEGNERAGAAVVVREGDGPNPLIQIDPGPEAAAIMAGGPIPRTNVIPETGADLAEWVVRVRDRMGWTASQTAEFLGLNRDTLGDAMRAKLLPLPPAVRDALTARLWGPDW
jgi:hypothetical protein